MIIRVAKRHSNTRPMEFLIIHQVFKTTSSLAIFRDLHILNIYAAVIKCQILSDYLIGL